MLFDKLAKDIKQLYKKKSPLVDCRFPKEARVISKVRPN